ncbi:MAG: ribonuclease III [Dehalococcoidia bacterium]|nr:ribonuclease III [Dehalococcoidia bacterium]MDP6227137.1 ribonuclease III [Dehalococcoidia bacterium]MDP7085079.1 ribonuclease III [Dehalococcoidia bacterium]MDP7199966.1 ribonuclease III [Dehalococcoidia bacterium]MDP7509979.1 ribonuclease III [Dehalococcoidia bacterium]
MAAEELESALGLTFRNRQLLEQALVHRSSVNEQGWSPTDSYERMEYLGDAVLELVVSEDLYGRFPDLSEGALTKVRSGLVCRESLAQVARRLNLGDRLLMGKGEEATGGRLRESTLAAAFEALVAAVYLDRDYAEARRFVLRVMAEELEGSYRLGRLPENPKSSLQEYVQGQGLPAPVYRVISSEGPDHDPVFTVEVLVVGEVIGVGHGGNKAGAERTAAVIALQQLTSESGTGSSAEDPK